MCTVLPLSAHTLSFVSHSAHNLSAVEKDTINTSALSTRIQFVPTIKSIRFLDLSCLYTIVITHAEQTCPNRRRLPKSGPRRRPLIYSISMICFSSPTLSVPTPCLAVPPGSPTSAVPICTHILHVPLFLTPQCTLSSYTLPPHPAPPCIPTCICQGSGMKMGL